MPGVTCDERPLVPLGHLAGAIYIMRRDVEGRGTLNVIVKRMIAAEEDVHAVGVRPEWKTGDTADEGTGTRFHVEALVLERAVQRREPRPVPRLDIDADIDVLQRDLRLVRHKNIEWLEGAHRASELAVGATQGDARGSDFPFAVADVAVAQHADERGP